MNIESYIYTIFSAIIGMLIVFLFLGFLSLTMAILKAIFKEKNRNIEKRKIVNKDIKVSDNKKPEWLIAAISSYFAIEEEELYPYSGDTWKASSSEKLNPWQFKVKLFKRRVGI